MLCTSISFKSTHWPLAMPYGILKLGSTLAQVNIACCLMAPSHNLTQCCLRGCRNGRPVVRNAILALSDKWLSLDTCLLDEQIIIAQMSFINLGLVHIWFRTRADAMLFFRRMSASQISSQPLWLIISEVLGSFTWGAQDNNHRNVFNS